ncbi:internal scaffolding protein [Blackfly microvirus SF02]|uniref:Internal scaffolding protein n=1 Tax=Blackfly microvirus SF02 TaxID=2576452 RepID=A0A4P8PK26_9VIRU|nr:internal scaffolding protein [Blackfly microvirus SF02]
MRYQGLNSNGEEISSVYVQHDPVDFSTTGPSATRQEFAEECDINILMAQYETTGTINHFNTGQPQYLDLTDVPDLQQSIDLMREAETAFMRLPAKTRATFDNNAVAFVDFAQDPANIETMREWGLARPAEPTGALKTEPATIPAASPASAG